MASHVELLMTSQRRPVADISHELRSPLARLSVALGLAWRTADPETNTSLNRIERETKRVNEARDRPSGGAGLGLSISDRVIRAHGGAVHAQNHPEGELVIELTLLIARPSEQVP
jgi:signal transduction histidine kinase